MLTWGDRILIALLVICSLAGIALPFFSQSAAAQSEAVISVAGKVVKTVKLDGHQEQLTIDGDSGYNIVQIEGKQVRVIESNCPDQLCVKQGWISRSPQQIVCLPNRIVVKIIHGKSSDVDTIMR
ncbi:hypothetical protein Ga0466249_002993 [Sporomusaceae bacterium BoRhaA]|uniref:NusG domain II-containing protein n=1 Tax=Pelorhabdus rhamnosifermentans TaxID=2772457 RepID=UPI001C0624D9|nr:NusG domain II-containing protein [Pelorhabdus rhamnosifermentans]MBU2701866.1 hypothetical protein [Pelorhabdus rhamnosifermentans]